MTIAASEPSDAAAMLDFGSNVTLSWKHLSRILVLAPNYLTCCILRCSTRPVVHS